MSKRTRRTFTKEFKQQMVDLYHAGKTRTDIIREYELTPSAFDKWIRQSNLSGSFSEKDNLTTEQKELQELRKKLKTLEMENDILKQAALIFGPKRQVITDNKDKYSISAMCHCLGISRATYYYKNKEKNSDTTVELAVVETFYNNRQSYGTRRIKKAFEESDIQISRKRIKKIMNKFHLYSTYTLAHFKVYSNSSNKSLVPNKLNRLFTASQPMEHIVTDLTYVRIGQKWSYVCLIIDLYNREIVGFSCGYRKNADLVKRAFSSIKYSLETVKLFHTDRGKEFDNQKIEPILSTFNISRSLSKPGCPYDNAVSESTYKSFKVEFVWPNTFTTLDQLSFELFDYVHWWHNIRYHSTLNYMSPIAYKIHRKMAK
ncbi:IS3 family transposase [Vagococcus fluvialis]|uniref:IS3 family transposase n=1 Tax=Vagococcus fluvialis TaxID=2738 RepID=UPI00378D666E